MWRNYLTIALRNLQKRRGFSLLNIFGLALGMCACLLILQYVAFERSYDTFHPFGKDIYRLRLDAYQEGRLAWQSATSYPAFAPTMKRELPEVVEACRLHDVEFVMTNPANNIKFAETKGYYADPAFLKMFAVALLSGNPETALTGPDKILLSENTARRYFGRTDVLGEQLLIKDPNFTQTYEVAGVFKNYPANSHLAIDYLVSYGTLAKIVAQIWGDTTNATETAWGWYDFYTFLQLQEGTDVEAFKQKFPAFVDKYPNATYIERKINARNDIDIIPLKDIHLYSNVNQEAEVNGDGRAVSVLLLVAFFILAIAWINYVNLSTARSIERGREVGVRKVLGARWGQLLRQFLVESLLLNGIAFVLALVAANLALPFFQKFTGKAIPSDFLYQPQFWLLALGVLTLGSIFSGLYPAFVLAAFRPVSVLKGALKHTTGGISLRKGLIIFQFTATIALITGTLIVFRQIQFMRSQDLGLNIEQTLVVHGAQTIVDSLYEDRFEPFRNQALAIPGVQNFTASSSVPGDEIYWTNGVRVVGQGEQAPMYTLFNIGVDAHFMDAYSLKLVAGRTFSNEFGIDKEHKSLLINETAARSIGFAKPVDALNHRIRRGRDTLTIVGITSDFHHQGLQKAINPVAFLFYPDRRNYYSLKINAENPQNTVAAVQQLWSSSFPDDPFEYFFLDDFFNQQYQADVQFGRVFSLFAMLAIIVACLGLLGLASYQIVQRTKEIGIRKVLGASTGGLVRLLSSDFLLLVVLAILIASPIAWWAMSKWLAGFAYRVDIEWWIFAVAGLLAVMVAFATVSVQSMRAALSNPLEALRSE
ncbi:MAG: ABC transporter permease [Lewinellaceae bacterium]|nr:ABC transporter permease [Saprospiraceae bacterium]MCB9330523.1 ABC transporter permease [Lewinellaceae bacterium]